MRNSIPACDMDESREKENCVEVRKSITKREKILQAFSNDGRGGIAGSNRMGDQSKNKRSWRIEILYTGKYRTCETRIHQRLWK